MYNGRKGPGSGCHAPPPAPNASMPTPVNELSMRTTLSVIDSETAAKGWAKGEVIHAARYAL